MLRILMIFKNLKVNNVLCQIVCEEIRNVKNIITKKEERKYLKQNMRTNYENLSREKRKQQLESD